MHILLHRSRSPVPQDLNGMGMASNGISIRKTREEALRSEGISAGKEAVPGK
jgi:hypothetical protein